MKLEVQFRTCAPNMPYLAALLKPVMFSMCISLLLHTAWYVIIYIACGAETAEKKNQQKVL